MPDPLPLVPYGHRACVTEIGGYIAMTAFSKMGVPLRRRPANILAFLRGGLLVTRFALTRRRAAARYQRTK